MVSHAHIISIYDMNAKVNREKSWIHMSAPYEEETYQIDENELMPLSEILKDPFKQCSLHIRMLKIRQAAGLGPPRIVVMFENNLVRTLTRKVEMKW